MILPPERDATTTAARAEDFDHSWLLCQKCGEIGIHRGRLYNPAICPEHGADTLAVYVRLDEVGKRDQRIVGEEHDQLRKRIDAMRESTDVEDTQDLVVRTAYNMALDEVLALLPKR